MCYTVINHGGAKSTEMTKVSSKFLEITFLFSIVTLLQSVQTLRTIGAHVVDDVNGFPARNVEVDASFKVEDRFMHIAST